MAKRGLLVFPIILSILLLAAVSAQDKIDIKTTKDTFKSGENITFLASLYDSQNNPMNGEVIISLINSEKSREIQAFAKANEISEISLGSNASFGYWKISASYNEVSSSSIFFIEENEVAEFEIEKDILKIKNAGNTIYSKNVQILIGESLGTKEVYLEPGESISFRLLAPDGTYNIRVSDGKTTLARNEIALTGNVISIQDTRHTGAGQLTVGATSSRNNTLIFIFLVMIVGAALLLLVERNYKKKLNQ